jgi:ABC-2 type transport system ATP-binding protein
MRRVTQQRRIEVQLVTAERIEQAASLVRQLASEATDVTAHPAEAVIRFRSAMPDRRLGEVLGGLVQAGTAVAQFRELQSDLEDAFLSVTREESTGAAEGERP